MNKKLSAIEVALKEINMSLNIRLADGDLDSKMKDLIKSQDFINHVLKNSKR